MMRTLNSDTKIYSTSESGFSVVELIMAMTLTVLILGVGVATFSGALGTRDRESSKTDALTSAQAALNIMSREIGNSGYGLADNGLVVGPNDSTNKRLHFRANTVNNGSTATDASGEDVTFYYDTASQSVVRYDKVTGTSGIINRVSDVDFIYYNYTYDPVNGVVVSQGSAGPTTARVNIKLTVILADVRGQPTNQTVTLSSDVTLRNSPFVLGNY
jgi:type II secretory pathway pseudopilin PulG